MPNTYTPSPRARAQVQLPSDGDRRTAASVAAPLQEALNAARFVRDVPARSWREGATLARALYGVAAGLGPSLDNGAGTTVRAPLVCGFGQRLLRSPDGLVWKEVDAAAYRTGCYSATLNRWVALGDNVLKTSPDTVTWTPRTIPLTGGFWGAAADPASGLIVACGSQSNGHVAVISSDDGSTWADVSPSVLGRLRAAAWSPGVSVLVGELSGGMPLVMRAERVEGEPLAFEEAAIAGDLAAPIEGVCYTGQRFVARAQDGAILLSDEGTVWDVVPASAPRARTTYGGTIAADPETGVVVTVGNGQGLLLVSYDHGETFVEAAWLVADADTYAHVSALCHRTDRFVAVSTNAVSAVSLGR